MSIEVINRFRNLDGSNTTFTLGFFEPNVGNRDQL